MLRTLAALVCVCGSLLVPSAAAAAADSTSTGVACAPATPATGTATTCSATVTDTSSISPTTPTGQVAFTSQPSKGQFSSAGICTLAPTQTAATASCQLSFTPPAGGSYTITGTYQADVTHQQSFGTFGLTSVDTTTTKVSCSPTSVLVDDGTDCTATVSDATGNQAILGTVTFGSMPTTTAAFGTPGSCTVSSTATTAAARCPIHFTPPAAGQYSVTATYSGDSSHAGSSGSQQVTATVEPPSTTTTTTTTGPPPPSPGSVRINSNVAVTKRGAAGVRLSCSGATGAICTGTLTLSTRIRLKLRARGTGKHRLPATRLVTIAIGSMTYTLAVGRTGPVTIKLSKTALSLLRATRRQKLTATAAATELQSTTVVKTVTLTLAGKPPRKHRHPKPKHRK